MKCMGPVLQDRQVVSAISSALAMTQNADNRIFGWIALIWHAIHRLRIVLCQFLPCGPKPTFVPAVPNSSVPYALFLTAPTASLVVPIRLWQVAYAPVSQTTFLQQLPFPPQPQANGTELQTPSPHASPTAHTSSQTAPQPSAQAKRSALNASQDTSPTPPPQLFNPAHLAQLSSQTAQPAQIHQPVPNAWTVTSSKPQPCALSAQTNWPNATTAPTSQHVPTVTWGMLWMGLVNVSVTQFTII